MFRNALRTLAVTLAISFAVDAEAVSAQTTFYACRVSVVGVIYLRTAGADPCLDAAHVQFQWTEGAAPADGSITTAKLADNAVATAKIANGAITTAKLAVPPRVAYSATNSVVTMTGVRLNLASVSITVGGAGSVVLQATGTTQLSGSNCAYIYYGISKTSAGAPVNNENYLNRPDYGATGTHLYAYHSMNTNFVDTVASSGTYTYYFVANGPNVAGCQVIPMGMTAIFIPS